ncbi:MAG TPA: ATP-binding protein [Planctomycetota bacterium]|nr:ATP-binding protein [Planctomycetota bacterium]
MTSQTQTSTEVSRDIRVELPAVPESILQAGRAIRCLGRSIGLSRSVTEQIVRAVCEVVLNACTYAYRTDSGTVVLRVTYDAHHLQIEVTDFGRGFRCDDYFLADGSRGPKAHPHSGLFIAAEAVDRLTIESGRTGTTVRMIKRV